MTNRDQFEHDVSYECVLKTWIADVECWMPSCDPLVSQLDLISCTETTDTASIASIVRFHETVILEKRIWGTMIGRQNLTIFGCYLSNKTKTQNIIAKSQSPSTRWLSNVHKLVPRPPHDSYNMYAPQFTSPQIVKVIWSSWQRSWSSILTLGWTMLWQSWWPWRLTKGAKKTAKSTMKL